MRSLIRCFSTQREDPRPTKRLFLLPEQNTDLVLCDSRHVCRRDFNKPCNCCVWRPGFRSPARDRQRTSVSDAGRAASVFKRLGNAEANTLSVLSRELQHARFDGTTASRSCRQNYPPHEQKTWRSCFASAGNRKMRRWMSPFLFPVESCDLPESRSIGKPPPFKT